MRQGIFLTATDPYRLEHKLHLQLQRERDRPKGSLEERLAGAQEKAKALKLTQKESTKPQRGEAR